MTDEIERMVAAARAQALQARASEAARALAAREQQVEAERQLAETLLTRVRPLLERLALALNRQIEGDWQVEWHSAQRGDSALRLGSAAHPAQITVAIGLDGVVTLAHRTGEHDSARTACDLPRLEPTLLALMPEWLERLMASGEVRFRD